MIFWFASLFAFSTLVSQSAMDLFSALLAIAVVVKVFAKVRGGERFRHLVLPVGFDWVWLVWIAIIGLSFALSPLGDTEWMKRILEFRWILILYVMIWALHDLRLKPQAQAVGSILLGFCSLYAIVVWFLGFDPINPNYDLAPWVGGHRTGGFLSNAMTFAHVYGTAFCLFVGPTLFALKWRARYSQFLIPALVLTAIALVLSFTRGVWISVAVATLVMAIIFQVRLGALLALGGGAMLWILTELWPTLKQRITSFSTSGDEREWIWRAHWKIFTDHPLTGVGYGENWRLLPESYQAIGAPEGTIVSHAHNQYLHFLAGTGVFGLLAYLVVLLCFFVLNVRVYREIGPREPFHKGLALGCLGAQISFWLGGLTEANFEHSKMKYVLLIVWSLVVWLAYEHRILRERV
jgi:O-antigen ligase